MSPEQYPAKFDAELDSAEQKNISDEDIPHILPILPLIEREPRYEESPSENGNEAKGCVYSRGLALYPHSRTVLARRAEIQRASGQGTDVLTINRSDSTRSARMMPAVGADALDDRGNRHSIPFPTDGSSVGRYPGSPMSQSHLKLGKGTAAASEEVTGGLQGTHSHTTRSRSSASSLNNEQSRSTATPPTEVVPDWSGSSGTIPPILETW